MIGQPKPGQRSRALEHWVFGFNSEAQLHGMLQQQQQQQQQQKANSCYWAWTCLLSTLRGNGKFESWDS
jgi:hypothetical protein